MGSSVEIEYPLLNQFKLKVDNSSLPNEFFKPHKAMSQAEINKKTTIKIPSVGMMFHRNPKIKNDNSVQKYTMQYYDCILNMDWELTMNFNQSTNILSMQCDWINQEKWVKNYLKIVKQVQFITNTDIKQINQTKKNQSNNLISNYKYNHSIYSQKYLFVAKMKENLQSEKYA